MQSKLVNLTTEYRKAETEGSLTSMGSFFLEQYKSIAAAGDKADLDVYETGSMQEIFKNLSNDTGL
jgi:hypothetical protein